MAEVYLAEQVSLGRRVAVKVLRPDLEADEVHVKRFMQEAKSAAALNHPNIVQVHSIGEADGMRFIAQEYVQGRNLQEFLSRHGTPELPQALSVMRQVAEALRAAGDAGIVHRDIKPDNIMIARKGHVKIADFGLAELAQSGEQLDLTQVGMTMGTPMYMSPEQVDGKKLDVRSDIYSFGVTCYHMLNGKPPFQGKTALSVAVKHVNETPVPLAERRPDLPPALCQLIHKMMAKNPEARYPNAGAVLQDIQQISKALKHDPESLAKLRIAETKMPRDPEEDGSAGRFFDWPIKKHLVYALVVFLIVGGLFAGLGWLLRPGNPLEG